MQVPEAPTASKFACAWFYALRAISLAGVRVTSPHFATSQAVVIGNAFLDVLSVPWLYVPSQAASLVPECFWRSPNDAFAFILMLLASS